MPYRLSCHSAPLQRTTAGKQHYADAEQAQDDADFLNERYAAIGVTYTVEWVDEAPASDATADQGDTATGEPGQGSAVLEQAQGAVSARPGQGSSS